MEFVKTTYDSKEECIKQSNMHDPRRSNRKYKNFKQFIYTCGDSDDVKRNIIDKRKEQSLQLKEVSTFINSETNDLFEESIARPFTYPMYNSPQTLDEAFQTTMRYMFYKLKFGIYVRIVDNKLALFVPFNNTQFKNDWWESIIINGNKTWEQYNKEKKNSNFEQDGTKWEINNCLLDTRKYRNYRLINCSYCISMFEQVLKTHAVKDCEFFINYRDFPVLKTDYTEPYNHLYDGDTVPLSDKYQNKRFVPIMSMSRTSRFADLLMPTTDDWEIGNQSIHHGQCRDMYKGFKPMNIWEKKINKVIFRGSTTDCGYDERTSMRYLAHALSNDNVIEDLDAGITKVWFNDVKLEGEQLHYPKVIQTVKPVEFETMSHYKYILNIDGAVTAFRLSAELSFGSVILKVDSPYVLWYSHLLEPMKHYIPIKSDMSDLKEKIEWCKVNDEKCQEIAQNAMEFYDRYINKTTMMKYVADTLNHI
jgi:hypothetical protein